MCRMSWASGQVARGDMRSEGAVHCCWCCFTTQQTDYVNQ